MRSLNVLVVDDEVGIRELIKDIAVAEGHKVTCAENGVEALARISDLSLDIVFLDIRMPKGDGLTALKEINVLRPNLPVIIITGCGSHEIMNEAIEYGATACMIKPFNVVDIINMLEAFSPALKNAA